MPTTITAITLICGCFNTGWTSRRDAFFMSCSLCPSNISFTTIAAGMQSGTIKYSKCLSGKKLAETNEYKNDNKSAILHPLMNIPPFVFFKSENPAKDRLTSNNIGSEYRRASGVISI